MTAAAASPSDILPELERWARVRGVLVAPDTPQASGREWNVVLDQSRVFIGHRLDGESFEASPALALAFALLVESGAASVDVGRCKGRGCTDGIQWAALWTERRTYPACTGTGRETLPAERLLLDAASGDANARALLEHHADATLRDRGDPLGDLLAWALTLWTGEPTESIVRTFTGQTRHDAQRQFMAWIAEQGAGWTLQMFGPSGQGPANRPAEEWTAVATSPELGHPHTAEALRWLEWLTPARPS